MMRFIEKLLEQWNKAEEIIEEQKRNYEEEARKARIEAIG